MLSGTEICGEALTTAPTGRKQTDEADDDDDEMVKVIVHDDDNDDDAISHLARPTLAVII